MIELFDPQRTFNQSFLIDVMAHFSYKNLDPKGCCYGISVMALQAILLDQLESFNNRLARLLEHLGEEFPNKLSIDVEMDALIDFRAFFDGIVLNQHPAKFRDILPQGPQSKRQDVKKTMPITMAQSLEHDKPVLIADVAGAYSGSIGIEHDEIVAFFNLLEDEIMRHQSVGLMLLAERHAISITYDVKKGLWIIIDPNYLPAAYMRNVQELRDFLLWAHNIPAGQPFCFQTLMYTRTSTAILLSQNIQELKQNTEWQRLHSLLISALHENDRHLVQDLLDLDINVLKQEYNGYTPLMYAIDRNSHELVNLLLTIGADPNQLNEDGITPLIQAASNNQLSIVESLLSFKAIVDKRSLCGDTALIQAAYDGYEPIVKLLLHHNASINFKGRGGDTALICAALNNHIDVVRLLLEQGAEIHQKNDEGLTAFLYAAQKSLPCIIEFFLESARCESALPAAIRLAFFHNNTAVLKVLVKAAHPGQPLLHAAVKLGAPAILEHLLHNEPIIDLNEKNEKGETPLDCALEAGIYAITRLLIGFSAQISQKMQATAFRSQDSKALVKYGSDRRRSHYQLAAAYTYK